MAGGRRSKFGTLLAGALAMLLLLVAIGLVVVFGGFFPVAASKSDPPVIGPILSETMEHGVRRSASGLRAPQLSDADSLEGGSHFKGMCQQCHGGPGVEREEFATAMNPPPPDLARAARGWSVEEVFWIAKHGLKMSGMPAFGKVDEDEELWKIAAFVKRLPKVSASQYASLPNAHEKGEAHEAGEGAHHH
jgi:mono/diheme cytochrome c family protein